jgi:hypothetical protein
MICNALLKSPSGTWCSERTTAHLLPLELHSRRNKSVSSPSETSFLEEIDRYPLDWDRWYCGLRMASIVRRILWQIRYSVDVSTFLDLSIGSTSWSYLIAAVCIGQLSYVFQNNMYLYSLWNCILRRDSRGCRRVKAWNVLPLELYILTDTEVEVSTWLIPLETTEALRCSSDVNKSELELEKGVFIVLCWRPRRRKGLCV